VIGIKKRLHCREKNIWNHKREHRTAKKKMMQKKKKKSTAPILAPQQNHNHRESKANLVTID
jgi:hypothetical protein